MEDLWKIQDLDYRLNDLEERAEYNRLVRRFLEEEHQDHLRDLLFGEATLHSLGKSGPCR